MAKFCGKCGTKLNEDTGLCPHCNMGIDNWAQNNTVPYSKSEDPLSRKERKKQKKQSKLNSMTFAQKVKRFILRVCLWLGLWIILGAIIASGLVHFEVIDIPVVSDVLQEIEIMLHLEHKWVEATCVEPRMCEKCDETEGEPLGHSWIPATCVDAQICSVCSEAGEGAIGHNWVDATCTDPRICLTCKETDGDAKGHTWIEASYKTPKTCQICGDDILGQVCYSKIPDSTIVSKTEGDSIKILERCYRSCLTCKVSGNDTVHNCETCREGYFKDYNNTNCVQKCDESFVRDLENYACI